MAMRQQDSERGSVKAGGGHGVLTKEMHYINSYLIE
jgi:hypothetical protein